MKRPPPTTTTAVRLLAVGLLALAAHPASPAPPAASAGPVPGWQVGKPHCWARAGTTQAWLHAGWRAWRSGETWQLQPWAGEARWQVLASAGQAAGQAAGSTAAPGCVLDRGTGLAWAVGLIGDDVVLHGSEPGSAWAHTAAANRVRACGHADWRLPTRAELLTLMHFAPAEGRQLMPGLAADGRYFWSSTAYPGGVTGLVVTPDYDQPGHRIPEVTEPAYFAASPGRARVVPRRLTERASLLLVRDAACHVGARKYRR